MKILKQHQKNAIAYLSKRFGGLLFMEMRLGKNLTMIRHLKQLGINNKILIVTDYGAMRGWELDISDEGEQVVVLQGSREARLETLGNDISNRGYVVANYESSKRLDLHKAKDWKVVILDETIKIANPRNDITKYFLSAFKHVKLKFVLNGKPMPENLMQLCCQFMFVHNTYMGCSNFWQYRAKYYTQSVNGFEWNPKPNHVKEVNEYVHKNAFVQTRKDAGVGSDKIYTNRFIKMNAKQVAVTKHISKYFEYEGVEYVNDLGLQIGMSYIAGGVSPSPTHDILSSDKLQELLNVINEVDDTKILVWCRFREEQRIIAEFLLANNIRHEVINGSLSKNERDEVKSNFEVNPKIKCALLTIKSSAKGQDWSCANTSIYYSREWSNDLQSQSEDRLIHVNKSEPVLIIHLLTEKSIDEDVMIGLKDKEFNSKRVMSNFLSRYTKK